MFSRYTERAQRVIVLAQAEARRLEFDYVGTETLLLGVLREGECTAAKALERLGVDLEALRRTLEQRLGRGGRPKRSEIGFTPPAKQVMVEHAIAEARHLGHDSAGTEHILLGLTRETDALACQLLAELGVDHKKLVRAVKELVGNAPERQALITFGPAAQTVLSLAQRAAQAAGAEAIEPEHLLLALAEAPPNSARAILAEQGITLDWLQRRLQQPPDVG